MPSRLVRINVSRGPRATLAQQSVRMRRADDGEAVLGLRIADRVAAGKGAARLADLGRSPVEDLRHHVPRQLLGERRDRQGEEDAATHREHVAHRVRGGDLAERAGIVDERWEEVDRADDREVVADAIRRRVVRWLEAGDELRRCRHRTEAGERLGQHVGTELGRTPAAIGERRETEARHVGERRHVSMIWRRSSDHRRRGSGNARIGRAWASALPSPRERLGPGGSPGLQNR